MHSYLTGSLVLAALVVAACTVTEGGPGAIPRDSVTVDVGLDPNSSVTYEFDLETTTSGSNEVVIIRTVPSSASLEGNDVSTTQTWTASGETTVGWPDSLEIGADETVKGVLAVTMTNNSQTKTAEFELTLIVEADNSLPEPTEETLYVDLALRES
jgi:hypothetical protein